MSSRRPRRSCRRRRRSSPDTHEILYGFVIFRITALSGSTNERGEAQQEVRSRAFRPAMCPVTVLFRYPRIHQSTTIDPEAAVLKAIASRICRWYGEHFDPTGI
jgi:hypothetical protein